MDWLEIGKNHLSAAKGMGRTYPRSAISRAYYAVHAALTGKLVERKLWSDAGARQTPSHQSLPKLANRLFARKGESAREVSSAVRRLYLRRIDADYSRRASVDAPAAVASLQDASMIFRVLSVSEEGSK
jgi:uncharacterized protein (UPF0332 family)